MKCPFILFLSLALLSPFHQVFASDIVETQNLYLSGTGSDDAVEWEFFCTAGAGSGEWTTIPVPSCWECQGFGQYVYGLKSNQDRLKESGLYRHTFSVQSALSGLNSALHLRWAHQVRSIESTTDTGLLPVSAPISI